jgi:uncharacterized protein YndB with AHSA1/START domain
MAAGNEPAGTFAGRVFTFARTFDAPRALVFQVWTDPKHVAMWWGPHRFTNPVCKWDARPGGLIHVDMRGPDGVVYPMSGVFHEVKEPERLAFSGAALDDNGKPLFDVLNTVTFVEKDGRTTVTLVARVGKTAAGADEYLKGMEAGWTQSLERLEGHVATASSDRDIVITRVFDAPRALVFEAWTDPKHVPQWWGPRGFTTTVQEMDVRPGGVWRYVMHGPDGTDFQNRVVYDEIDKPERLAYTHGSDEEPDQFRVTVTFAGQGGKTRVTLRMRFASAAARDGTIEFGAVQGGNQTLDRLTDHLANIA